MTVIPDTNVWIEWLRRGAPGTRDETGGERVLLATVTLQELWAGVTSEGEARDVDRLYELARGAGRLVNPRGPAWILSGRALAALVRRGKVSGARLRAIRNDVLLAATAVTHDAAVLTHDTRDFGAIAQVLPLRFVSPRS